MPEGVNLTDDPTLKEFQGQELIGAFDVDQEGIKTESVALVVDGILRSLLMSRRPGPELVRSNGHGRATNLADPKPMPGNLFLTAADGMTPEELRQEFLTLCRENGQEWGLIVRRMDHPVIASSDNDELSEWFGRLAAGAQNGDRLPLLVYRVNVQDGREELVRGAVLSRLTSRSLRSSLAGIGSDSALFSYLQSQDAEIMGTALGAFGTSDNGIPTTLAAPSLLFEEVEVRGQHNEARRMPVVPPPPL
jgi:hypothetical protein